MATWGDEFGLGSGWLAGSRKTHTKLEFFPMQGLLIGFVVLDLPHPMGHGGVQMLPDAIPELVSARRAKLILYIVIKRVLPSSLG